jgi:aminocarboxymuconate-semialdehyde decarboxylase
VDLIDVHSHVVCREFPDNPAPETELRWPCMCHGPGNAATVTIAGRPFREIDARSWDSGCRLADMDASGVTRQALSPMPELLSYWFPPAVGRDMCRWVNHAIGEMMAANPQRFSGLGCVPLQDPELAAGELERLKRDGFCGVEIGSNINGKLLGERVFEVFYAEAERLDLAIFVHALHPIGAERLSNLPDLVPFAAFPLDTALSAISLIRSGVVERHPTLRLGFSHGGGAIIPLVHRLGKGAAVTANFRDTLTESPLAYARRFFFDNLVYDAGYAAYLANEFAPGQVFCGTDYPYAIMETDPAGCIDAASYADQASVRHGAAERFLGLNPTRSQRETGTSHG